MTLSPKSKCPWKLSRPGNSSQVFFPVNEYSKIVPFWAWILDVDVMVSELSEVSSGSVNVPI